MYIDDMVPKEAHAGCAYNGFRYDRHETSFLKRKRRKKIERFMLAGLVSVDKMFEVGEKSTDQL